MSQAGLARLLRPRTLAVYGGRWSDYVVAQCQRLGFDGEIWRVHPTRDGCFRHADELPAAPDSVFLGINRDATLAEMARLRDRGAGGVVVFASGFGEVADHERVAALAKAAGGMPFLGPNCYGFANFFDRVALWPDQAVGSAVDRGVAIIGQSGTISLTLMYQRRSLPTGYVVTVGNQQCLGIADLVRHLAADTRVSAIGLYVEGLGDAADFVDAVDCARRHGTPLALVKAGRSDRSRAAALSHTGAMTGADELHDALFRGLGVARCDTLDELVETLKLFHCHGPLSSASLLVTGASGGDMAMVADVARDLAIDFPALEPATTDALADCTGPGLRFDNPFDFQTHTWFDGEKMRRMFSALLEAGAALTVFMLDPPDENEADPAAYDVGIDAFLAAARDHPAAVLCSLPESLSRYNRDKCLAAGVLPAQGLSAFLRAVVLAAACGAAWRSWQPPAPRPVAMPACRRTLREVDAKALLGRHGIAVPQGIRCAPDQAAAALASLGGPVVVKAVADDLAHKTEHGGVVASLFSAAEVTAAALSMTTFADEVLVEEMILDSVAELLVGIGTDPQFGRYLTLGAGGVLAELLADTVTLLPPFDRAGIIHALSRLAVFGRLAGWRGGRAGNIDATADTVLALWRFAVAVDAVEVEINPLLVGVHGAVAVDALLTLPGEDHV